MKCALCRPLLSKYVDGEATPAERAQVEAHIGGCEACSRMLVEFRVLRSRVGDLPNYRPEPRLRARLFSAIEAADKRADEIVITRRPADIPLRPVRVAPQRRPMLFGNLVSMAALAIVVAAVALVWQIAGNPYNTPVAYATGTALVGTTSIIAVPTRFNPIANTNGLPNPQATAIVKPMPQTQASDQTGGRPASPTAALWTAAEDTAMIHTVRDETYGYQFQYPSGWWTAAGIAPAGLLGRRVLRPWNKQDAETPDYSLTLDVLANPAGLTRDAALKNAQLLASWGEHGTARPADLGNVNGMNTATLQSDDQAAGVRRWATYLFAGTLVYRVSREVAIPKRLSGTNQIPNDLDNLGSAVAGQVLQTFLPAADAAGQSLGYVPLLYLQNGNLWQADPAGDPPRQVTRFEGEEKVIAFALAPDLRRVALLLSNGDARWGHRIDIQPLDAPASSVLWITNEIHAVAWYGDQELVAIGGAPAGGDTPLGLYRLLLQPGKQVRLVDFSAHPDVVKSAYGLAVAPDRRWISFLAGDGGQQDLYGVRPDGTGLRSLLPGTAHPAVVEYAWLPPFGTGATDRLVLIASDQLDQISLAGPNETDARMDAVVQLPNVTFTGLAVAPGGEIAALTTAGNRPQVYMRAAQEAPGAFRMLDLPATPLPASLGTTPRGQHLYFWEAGAAPRLQMFDTASRTIHVLVGDGQ